MTTAAEIRGFTKPNPTTLLTRLLDLLIRAGMDQCISWQEARYVAEVLDRVLGDG